MTIIQPPSVKDISVNRYLSVKLIPDRFKARGTCRLAYKSMREARQSLSKLMKRSGGYL
jgi:hypothetical protein